MANIITLENATAENIGNIKNETLRNYTSKIFEYAFNMRQNALRIAAIMAIIQESKDDMLSDYDGKVEVFGENVLGLKRAQTFAYCKVGREFLNSEGKCLITEPTDSAYTMTQLQALLPLGKELADKLANEKVISPTMTVAQLKSAVKENDPKKAEKEAAKQKREKKQQEREDAKAKAEEVIFGKVIHTITVSKKVDGSYIVKMDDEDITTTNIGKYLIKNCK